MAYFGDIVDINNLPKPKNSFDPIPAGWYAATITKAELKETKAKTGSYLAIRYDILGPSHQGRVVFGNLNIKNPNLEAERIGRESLESLFLAIGKRVNHTEELIGENVEIKVKITTSEQYGDQNDVAGFKSINGSKPPMPKASAEQQPAAAVSAAPPWVKG